CAGLPGCRGIAGDTLPARLARSQARLTHWRLVVLARAISRIINRKTILKKVCLTPLPPSQHVTLSALSSFYCLDFSQVTPRLFNNAPPKNLLPEHSQNYQLPVLPLPGPR